MAGKQSKASSWLVVAIASGACAAFNGVFAKLTTTELTASWSSSIAQSLSLSPSNKAVEYGIRGLFFGLNLVFNAIMWGLFTRALTLASSTVRVSVINTSANFMITAVLGLLIFSESLPGQWWLGAALLVAGSVIIGMREEGKGEERKGEVGAVVVGAEPLLDSEGEPFWDGDEEVNGGDVDLDHVGKKDVDKGSTGKRSTYKSSDDEDGALK